MRLLLKIASTLAFFGLSASVAVAHELILKPETTNTTPGNLLEFAILSTHRFMEAEELENIELVESAIFQNGEQQNINLQTNLENNQIEGNITLNNNRPAYLLAHRLGAIWSMTTEGMKEGTKATLEQEVLWSGKYEKFAKTLINASPNDETYNTPVNQLLEIIPLRNPATVPFGDDLPVQILYKGEPLATSVFATYDGFTETPVSYAYYTETNADGIAQIRLTVPGLWMVRVQHTEMVENADYDRHITRSVLSFEVN
ncbi:MAG: DUF4198 domain-containing protein [Jaaginema sp. PMC 1079.18]|nr:DUF4198 domain-containing protein [Jaaginema sp. PMC 1080.18]MEC4849426.1 DUF4198 domain-containing protein [Jaaginema sp. PMC 1079.18]MEC4864942.1 DUF4198 domain-containing protein [Jaaginema sp. PMC 1078.18]